MDNILNVPKEQKIKPEVKKRKERKKKEEKKEVKKEKITRDNFILKFD